MTDSDDLDTMEDDEDGHPSSKSNLIFSFSTSVFKPFRIKIKHNTTIK